MSILNQAITPKGQPEVAQHIPMALPLHGTHSLKPYHTGLSNRNLSAIATGDSPHRGSVGGVPVDGLKTQTQTSMLDGPIDGIRNLSEFDPWALNFSRSLVEDEKLIDAIVVAVSSAVKLNNKQIELISRKMQRLTGSRKLKLENIIDPSLIAGFVISYDDDGSVQVIDHSVKGELAALTARVESSDRRSTNHGQC